MRDAKNLNWAFVCAYTTTAVPTTAIDSYADLDDNVVVAVDKKNVPLAASALAEILVMFIFVGVSQRSRSGVGCPSQVVIAERFRCVFLSKCRVGARINLFYRASGGTAKCTLALQEPVFAVFRVLLNTGVPSCVYGPCIGVDRSPGLAIVPQMGPLE